MTRPAAGGSGNRSARIDRLRNLVSFDLALASVANRDQIPDRLSAGETPMVFDDSASHFEDHVLSRRLVGFDEAGRGSLAGPVTVACVSFDLSRLVLATGELRDSIPGTYCDLNDSKRVTKRNRERLYAQIVAEAHWGIGCASAVEIDRLGIVKACRAAASRAYRCLVLGRGFAVDLGLFDRGLSLDVGDRTESIPSSVQVTRGDGQSFHIAAASILAKVRRDAIMRELDPRVPGYGFASHKGYGTAAHISAIRGIGPSKFHRRTFLSRVLGS
ncbi:ribonuclease HII [Candidatus Bipolaricaulota bacterium]